MANETKKERERRVVCRTLDNYVSEYNIPTISDEERTLIDYSARKLIIDIQFIIPNTYNEYINYYHKQTGRTE